MTTQSNICECNTCVGPQCTCGCQTTAPVSTASCRCGDACACGEACSCAGCQHDTARVSESR